MNNDERIAAGREWWLEPDLHVVQLRFPWLAQLGESSTLSSDRMSEAFERATRLHS